MWGPAGRRRGGVDRGTVRIASVTAVAGSERGSWKFRSLPGAAGSFRVRWVAAAGERFPAVRSRFPDPPIRPVARLSGPHRAAIGRASSAASGPPRSSSLFGHRGPGFDPVREGASTARYLPERRAWSEGTSRPSSTHPNPAKPSKRSALRGPACGAVTAAAGNFKRDVGRFIPGDARWARTCSLTAPPNDESSVGRGWTDGSSTTGGRAATLAEGRDRDGDAGPTGCRVHAIYTCKYARDEGPFHFRAAVVGASRPSRWKRMPGVGADASPRRLLELSRSVRD